MGDLILRKRIQAVSNQINLDNKVVELSETLKEAFTFVDDTNELHSRTRLLEHHITILLQTTSECCEYIHGEYSKHGFVGMPLSSCSNSLLNSEPGRIFALGSSEKVDGFIQAFQKHKNDLDLSIDVHNALVAGRISEKVDLLCK